MYYKSPEIAPLAQPANPLEATTGEATTGAGAPTGGAPAGTAMSMEDLGSGSYPDRGSVAYDSHQNALPTYLLRAPIARLRAPPTYLFPGRAAKRKNTR